MCNHYHIKGPPSSLANQFDAMIQRLFDFDEEVYPKRQAPVLILNEDRNCEIVPMRFGLVPYGSTLEKTKRPLNNARIERLDSWPWKMSIKRNRCAIPISSFFEFSYYENHAGHKLEFVSEKTMFAAGIYSKYEEDGLSMTIITRPGTDFIMGHGHHRMPMFIDPSASMFDWLEPKDRDTEKCCNILKHSAIDPEFEVLVHEQMKAGWQKRIDAAEEKRNEQLAAIQKSGPLGI